MMEHGRFPYSPIAGRTVVRMPESARVAVWITPNVEHYHWGKPAIALTQMTASLKPDVLNYAWRDYGARVGIWRIMEILERQGFVATAALNAEVCEQYPQIVEAGNRLGWEWMAHGPNNSMLFTGMPEEAERPIIAGVLDTIARATGRRSRGWLGPALTESWHTGELLTELGYTYTLNWAVDDEPFRLRSGLISVPYSSEVNDLPAFVLHKMSGLEFRDVLIDQFDQLLADGADRPRIMGFGLHPFLVGQPYRAKHLATALEHMAAHRDDVWFATSDEIAAWYASTDAAD